MKKLGLFGRLFFPARRSQNPIPVPMRVTQGNLLHERHDHGTRTVPAPKVSVGSNWYFVEDGVLCLRQVVLMSDPKRALSSRYGRYLISLQKYHGLYRNPLAIELVRHEAEARTFLVLRADPLVEEVSKSSLKVAFSFFHLPMGGLAAVHVSCEALQERTTMGFLEQIYGLDCDTNRDLFANVINGWERRFEIGLKMAM